MHIVRLYRGLFAEIPVPPQPWAIGQPEPVHGDVGQGTDCFLGGVGHENTLDVERVDGSLDQQALAQKATVFVKSTSSSRWVSAGSASSSS